MNFTSYGFIIFAAAVLLLYYILPQKVRWTWLLLASAVFFAFSGRKGLFFIISTVIVIYIGGRIIEKINGKIFVIPYGIDENDRDSVKKAKNNFKNSVKRKVSIVTAVCILFSVTMLLMIRFSSRLAVLGASFYTLQAIGYLVDVKRKKYACEKNFFKFALFMIFFPALAQGPINRYDIMSKTLFAGGEGRKTSHDIAFGLTRMAWGFFEKVVIADRIAVALSSIIENKMTGIYVLAAMIFYAIRLYGDFKGGIDIALGLSRALGIIQSENFDKPYFSKSIAEYWRRWHITLGTWMKDYVFYPVSVSKPMLKLSKKAREKLGNGLGKRIPVYASTLAVWILTGLWHGNHWNFVLWGMLNCVIILFSQECNPLYKKFANKFPELKKSGFYGGFEVVRTFFLMSTLRMLDCYTNVGDYFSKLGSIFTGFIPDGFSFASFLKMGISGKDYIITAVGCIMIFSLSFWQKRTEEKNIKPEEILTKKDGTVSALVPAACFALIFITVIFGAYGRGYDVKDFIYTRF